MDWIQNSEWGGIKVGGRVSRGCPQGGVLSPTLWSMVVDALLRRLNDEGFYSQGYADDFVILLRGAYLDTLMGLTRSALQSVKYLGVILNRKINWVEHLEAQCRRFTTTLWLCKRAFGRTRGLWPGMIGMIAWLYSAILKPMLLYAAEVYWPQLLLKTVQAKMSRLQTLIFRGIAGAMRTAPTAAVGFTVCEVPIHIAIIAEATQTMGRLTAMGKWMRGANIPGSQWT